jgi:hypothetical protein
VLIPTVPISFLPTSNLKPDSPVPGVVASTNTIRQRNLAYVPDPLSKHTTGPSLTRKKETDSRLRPKGFVLIITQFRETTRADMMSTPYMYDDIHRENTASTRLIQLEISYVPKRETRYANAA